MFDVRNFKHFAAAMVLVAGLTAVSGCKTAADGSQVADNSGPDPADVNQAPVDSAQSQQYAAVAQPARTWVLGQTHSAQPQQTATSYPQQAPIERAPDPSNYTPPQTYQNNDPAYQPGDENFDQTIDEYAEQPPPPLPVYEQPPCPEPNYLWTPGYWSYASAGYFWVPGAWAAPPYYGALWTPGYWGVFGNRYGFHRGFWGLHIGFYGGIAYGFGYTGSGYHGGYWNGNNFYYNRAVNRVNVTNIHNTYVRNVTINNTVVNNRISFNGRGGVQARPAAYELAAMREQHTPPMAAQVQLREQSQQNRQQFFNENKGRPAAIFASRPLAADRGIARPAFQQAVRPEVPSGGQPNNRTVQGGFGGQAQRNEVQQRNQQGEQRNLQQGNAGQQRNQQEQQRNIQQQQEQQRNVQTQQRNLQQNQQRNAQMQQHDQQQQQRNLQQQQQDQQRNEQQQQHNQQLQQQQQRNDQQRNQQQLQQRNEQQHNQQQQQRNEQQPRVQEQRQPPQPQPRAEPQRAAPQPQPRQETRPAERPHPEGHPPH